VTPRPSVVVFDIDGVLADVSHRLHHLRERPKDWDAFFTAAADDPVLEPGRERAVQAAREHALVYLSGRPERLREVSEQWLARHGLPPGLLLLRPDRDRRPARLLKAQMLRRLARGAQVVLVVDDDAEVCAALRASGYPVEQAGWQPPPAELRRAQDDEGRT
jgi:phosphoglycolate phosphatase-like HAD superfamily hydrolase